MKGKRKLLQSLPAVDAMMKLAESDPFFAEVPRTILVSSLREAIENCRTLILRDDSEINQETLCKTALLERARATIAEKESPNLRSVVNATGVVVHTNLGRSPLAEKAAARVAAAARAYSNLEYDLVKGERGSRFSIVEGLLCELGGAEAAMAVNNNAAAVLLALSALACGKETVVSRGELVEIGGSFRIPDIMEAGGSVLKEVGTTNRTHLRDYADAICEDTAMLLKVHKSNYAISGFTRECSLKELVTLAGERGVHVMEDLGSGTLIDFSGYGLKREPTVQEAVATGADIVTFSGDKLLGGPQAGIIMGREEVMRKLRRHPLTRAFRMDKLTLAALEATLRLYRDEAVALREIPTLRMLTASFETIRKKALQLQSLLEELGIPGLSVSLNEHLSRVGGGALPEQAMPSVCVGLTATGLSADAVAASMRSHSTPVIGVIERDVFLMDQRTVLDDEFSVIKEAVKAINFS